MKQIQPAVTRLWFRVSGNSARNYVDLSLACSAANRRFYRQGTTWAVAGMSVHTAPLLDKIPSGDFTVSKIPDTWVAKNAHTKAKALWMESQKQVLDDQPSIVAKYRDFKIYLDDDMVGASINDSNDASTTGQIMLPIDSGDFTTKIGEWIYSTIQLPDAGGSNPPTEITMHMVGDDVGNSRSLIKGYGLSRSRPQEVDPNVPTSGGWMNDVFDVADNLDEIRDDVHNNNDEPPYRVGDPASALEFYPGGVNNCPAAALHSISFVSGTTVGGKTNVEGGMFGCGLLKFEWDIDNIEELYLAIDLVPGQYKGYLTEVY
jgi:hypothetical protein